jgi:hypothetical protein
VTLDVAGDDEPLHDRAVGGAGDLSDELIAQPSSTQEVLERIMEALERIEAKIDGTWCEGPNPL